MYHEMFNATEKVVDWPIMGIDSGNKIGNLS